MAIKKRGTIVQHAADNEPEKLVIVAGPKKKMSDDSRIADMYNGNEDPALVRRVGLVGQACGLGPDENLTLRDRVTLMRTPYDHSNPQEARYRNRVRNRGTAITAFCITCAGGRKAVGECVDTKCPLWAFRLGGDPFRGKR